MLASIEPGRIAHKICRFVHDSTSSTNVCDGIRKDGYQTERWLPQAVPDLGITRAVVMLGATGESDPRKAIDLIAFRAGL